MHRLASDTQSLTLACRDEDSACYALLLHARLSQRSGCVRAASLPGLDVYCLLMVLHMAVQLFTSCMYMQLDGRV